ncbi:MAG TPA: hypothetical protein VJC12_03635 [Candidatus Paceibacterota bacterium]
MEKKSKIFFSVFFILIAISIAIMAYRFLYLKDYVIFLSEDEIPEVTLQSLIYGN